MKEVNRSGSMQIKKQSGCPSKSCGWIYCNPARSAAPSLPTSPPNVPPAAPKSHCSPGLYFCPQTNLQAHWWSSSSKTCWPVRFLPSPTPEGFPLTSRTQHQKLRVCLCWWAGLNCCFGLLQSHFIGCWGALSMHRIFSIFWWGTKANMPAFSCCFMIPNIFS